MTLPHVSPNLSRRIISPTPRGALRCDQLVAASNSFGSRMPRRMTQLRRNFRQRHENKSPLRHPRMRHLQLRRSDRLFAIQKNIDVENPRPFRDHLLAPHPRFDRTKLAPTACPPAIPSRPRQHNSKTNPAANSRPAPSHKTKTPCARERQHQPTPQSPRFKFAARSPIFEPSDRKRFSHNTSLSQSAQIARASLVSNIYDIVSYSSAHHDRCSTSETPRKMDRISLSMASALKLPPLCFRRSTRDSASWNESKLTKNAGKPSV